jgi:DNA (cytosine-5)-methyltransferase 1
VLENVKNLASHDKGNTIRVIRDVLKNELGYELHERIIDARHFVPQHRERIFLVGFREPTKFSFERDLVLPDANHILGSILHPENGTEQPEEPYTVGERARVAPRYTLTPKLWEYLQNYAEKHRQKGNGFGFGLVKPGDVTRTLSARYYKDGSEILVWQKGKNPRRLTPRECARLMGFESPERRFAIPVSDTRAYKQFGNAVVVPVVEAVARSITPHLRAILRADQKHAKSAQDERQRSLPLAG